jgi:putative transposase
MVLRHQVMVRVARCPGPRPEWADRAILAALARLLPPGWGAVGWSRREPCWAWYRRLISRKWTYLRRPPQGTS